MAPENAPKKAKSNINQWYPRYVRDYREDTTHLSLTEHGAYAILLDQYYVTEQPLPTDAMQLQRICRAFDPHEIEAMHSVLRQFFLLTPEGYRNSRADIELAKRNSIREVRSVAAHSRHRGPSTALDANDAANADTGTGTITTTTNCAQPAAPKMNDLHEAVEEALSCARLRENVNGTDGPTVSGWLKRGATLRDDILPTIERIVQYKLTGKKKLPGSLSYYTDAIFDDIALRKGSGPQVTVEPPRRTMAEALAAINVQSVIERTTDV